MKPITLITVAGLGVLLATNAQSSPEAKITIVVTSEKAVPLSSVEVGVTFEQPKYKPNQWGSADVLTLRGQTDTAGAFSATASGGNYVSYGTKRNGFYPSHGNFQFIQSEKGMWQPWNPTVQMVLKKIINPVATYARRVNRALPTQTERAGFDMFVGDFVAPYGRGKVADMTFQLESADSAKDPNRRRLAVSLANPQDGILPFNPTEESRGSELRSPYRTPDAGFLPNWTVTRSELATPTSANYDPQKHGFFFRIRTSVDSTGKIVSANYGKIYGDFMSFTYYLNPTPNDRNIEFDPKRNLFTNLKPDERVTEP